MPPHGNRNCDELAAFACRIGWGRGRGWSGPMISLREIAAFAAPPRWSVPSRAAAVA
jgi:hypothetical protein